MFRTLTCRSALLILLFMLTIASIQSVSFGQAGAAVVAQTQGDSADALKRLLMEAIAAAKSGNDAQVDEFVKSVKIPNYKEWFAAALYDDRWTSPPDWKASFYEQRVSDPNFGLNLKSSLHEMARRRGKVVFRRMRDDEIGAPKGPIEIFQASWQDEGELSSDEPQWKELFVFIDHGFRWYCVSFRATYFPLPQGFQRIRCVQPTYPYPRDGRHPGGIVRLSFTLQADGNVNDVRTNGAVTSSTDPMLIQAAVEAASLLRFVPVSPTVGREIHISDIGIEVLPN